MRNGRWWWNHNRFARLKKSLDRLLGRTRQNHGGNRKDLVPLIPPPKRGGGKRTVNIREVLNGIFYVLWTGCQWKALPKDLPPKSTVHWYFMLWDWDGTLERLHQLLRRGARAGRSRGKSDGRDHRQMGCRGSGHP
jgi:transposase